MNSRGRNAQFDGRKEAPHAKKGRAGTNAERRKEAQPNYETVAFDLTTFLLILLE